MGHKLIINFGTLDDMLEWADNNLDDSIAVYRGDTMDVEFTGAVPKDTYVLRHKGSKPEGMEVSR